MFSYNGASEKDVHAREGAKAEILANATSNFCLKMANIFGRGVSSLFFDTIKPDYTLARAYVRWQLFSERMSSFCPANYMRSDYRIRPQLDLTEYALRSHTD